MNYRENNTKAPGSVPSLTDLLTEAQASAATGHPKTVLAQYRVRRRKGADCGPDFVKIGRAVFYTKAAVAAYNIARGV